MQFLKDLLKEIEETTPVIKGTSPLKEGDTVLGTLNEEQQKLWTICDSTLDKIEELSKKLPEDGQMLDPADPTIREYIILSERYAVIKSILTFDINHTLITDTVDADKAVLRDDWQIVVEKRNFCEGCRMRIFCSFMGGCPDD